MKPLHVLIITALTFPGLAATAEAHELSQTAMRKAAAPVATKIKRETKVPGTRLHSCTADSDHRGRCRVVSRHSNGITCTTTVDVVLRGMRARASVGRSLCD